MSCADGGETGPSRSRTCLSDLAAQRLQILAQGFSP